MAKETVRGEVNSLGQGVHCLLGGQSPLVLRSVQEGLNLKTLQNTKQEAQGYKNVTESISQEDKAHFIPRPMLDNIGAFSGFLRDRPSIWIL